MTQSEFKVYQKTKSRRKIIC